MPPIHLGETLQEDWKRTLESMLDRNPYGMGRDLAIDEEEDAVTTETPSCSYAVWHTDGEGFSVAELDRFDPEGPFFEVRVHASVELAYEDLVHRAAVAEHQSRLDQRRQRLVRAAMQKELKTQDSGLIDTLLIGAMSNGIVQTLPPYDGSSRKRRYWKKVLIQVD